MTCTIPARIRKLKTPCSSQQIGKRVPPARQSLAGCAKASKAMPDHCRCFAPILDPGAGLTAAEASMAASGGSLSQAGRIMGRMNYSGLRILAVGVGTGHLNLKYISMSRMNHRRFTAHTKRKRADGGMASAEHSAASRCAPRRAHDPKSSEKSTESMQLCYLQWGDFYSVML